MNQQQRVVAALTIVFVMLFAAIGATFVSRSGAQQVAANNTPAAQDLGNRLDPGSPGTTAAPGTTATTQPPPTTANPGCEQDGSHDVADCVSERLDPGSTTSGTSPPGSEPGTTAAPGTSEAPTTTAAPSTTAATTPSTSAPPQEPITPTWINMTEAERSNLLHIAVDSQKVARERMYDLGFSDDGGVTCSRECILSGGIKGDTPQQMSVDILAKMVKSPLALDSTARFILGDKYDDPRSVGDLDKAANDFSILVVFMVESFKAGQDPTHEHGWVEVGVIPAGTTLWNTVVENGEVKTFQYTTTKERRFVKFHLGDVTLGFFDSCGNLFGDNPPPDIPQIPEPCHDDNPACHPPPSSEPPSTPPPTGGPTTTPPPHECPPGTIWNPVKKECGKLDTHPAGPQSPTPTQVQGPGPTHPAGPPNTGINPGQPNPTTGCNPSPCQGATTTTTRAAPPSSAPVQPSQPKPSTPTTMGGP